MQYLALIHADTRSATTPAEWEHFFAVAERSGLFRGGSALGSRLLIGSDPATGPTDTVGGYMRFDAENAAALRALLAEHPVVLHGGTVELCEMVVS